MGRRRRRGGLPTRTPGYLGLHRRRRRRRVFLRTVARGRLASRGDHRGESSVRFVVGVPVRRSRPRPAPRPRPRPRSPRPRLRSRRRVATPREDRVRFARFRPGMPPRRRRRRAGPASLAEGRNSPVAIASGVVVNWRPGVVTRRRRRRRETRRRFRRRVERRGGGRGEGCSACRWARTARRCGGFDAAEVSLRGTGRRGGQRRGGLVGRRDARNHESMHPPPHVPSTRGGGERVAPRGVGW